MKQENLPILEKYMGEYDLAHAGDVKEYIERHGLDKDGDERWAEYVDERIEAYEQFLVRERRLYRQTVRMAIEAKEKGESFPMFPITEDVK